MKKAKSGPCRVRPETLLNPPVPIEVLSDATASYDRGEKREHYRQRASVQSVVLIDSRRRSITVTRVRPLDGGRRCNSPEQG